MGNVIRTIQFPVRCEEEGCETAKEVLGKYKGPRQKTAGEREEGCEVDGGGPSTSKHDDEAAALASIIPAQIESLSNMFDDDNCERGKTMPTRYACRCCTIA